MFQKEPELAPISMIITNLAASAYEGETDQGEALTNIVARMGSFVRPSRLRVLNHADPAEDYTDEWSRDPNYESNFWRWLAAAKADVGSLPMPIRNEGLGREIGKLFRVGPHRGSTPPVHTESVSNRTGRIEGGPGDPHPVGPQALGHRWLKPPRNALNGGG
jgi:hypothetical protein